MNENLKVMVDFKGYGNPSGKYWFIGMEERLEINGDSEIGDYKRGIIFNKGGDYSLWNHRRKIDYEIILKFIGFGIIMLIIIYFAYNKKHDVKTGLRLKKEPLKFRGFLLLTLFTLCKNLTLFFTIGTSIWH